MSYYDFEPKSKAGKIGKQIYLKALADRRGFRDDQLGIEDNAIWNEIFVAVGRAAISAVKRGMGE